MNEALGLHGFPPLPYFPPFLNSGAKTVDGNDPVEQLLERINSGRGLPETVINEFSSEEYSSIRPSWHLPSTSNPSPNRGLANSPWPIPHRNSAAQVRLSEFCRCSFSSIAGRADDLLLLFIVEPKVCVGAFTAPIAPVISPADVAVIAACIGKHDSPRSRWDPPFKPQLFEPSDGNLQPNHPLLHGRREVPLGEQLDHHLQSCTHQDFLGHCRLREKES